MMDKAWCSLGEVPYGFSSVKYQGHTAKNIQFEIGRFRTVAPV